MLTTLLNGTVDPNTRLRIATRIHFALLRHYGEDIGVSALLEGEGDTREALWVCEASGHEELMGLAQQFKAPVRSPAPAAQSQSRVMAHPAITRSAEAAPQDMAWSQDTSGFGLSLPAELGEQQAPARPARWLRTPRWLRGATLR